MPHERERGEKSQLGRRQGQPIATATGRVRPKQRRVDPATRWGAALGLTWIRDGSGEGREGEGERREEGRRGERQERALKTCLRVPAGGEQSQPTFTRAADETLSRHNWQEEAWRCDEVVPKCG